MIVGTSLLPVEPLELNGWMMIPMDDTGTGCKTIAGAWQGMLVEGEPFKPEPLSFRLKVKEMPDL